MKLSFLNSRYVRIGLALSLVSTFVVTFVPNIFSHENIDGVVNANIVTMTTPIEGDLNYQVMPIKGTTVFKDQTIAVVDNVRIDRSYYFGIKSQLTSNLQKVIALQARHQELAQLKETIASRAELHKSFYLTKLKKQLEIQKHDIAAVNATMEFYKSESSRLSKISHVLSTTQVAQSQANYIKAQNELNSLTAAQQLTEILLNSAVQGVFLGEGFNDVPYSNQKIDDIKIIQSEITSLVDELQQHNLAMAQQVDEEQTRLNKNQQYTVISPVNGIVWRVIKQPNAPLVINSEIIQLLDCDSVFLDVVVSERYYSSLIPGTTVSYRLYGDDDSKTGVIDSVQGSGIIDHDTTQSATLDVDGEKEFRINIKINQKDIDKTSNNYCQVGRRVIVKFPRIL